VSRDTRNWRPPSAPWKTVRAGGKQFVGKTFAVKVRLHRRNGFPVPGSHDAAAAGRGPLREKGKARGPFDAVARKTFTGWPARRRGFSRRQYICGAHVIRAFRRPGAHNILTTFGGERARSSLAAARPSWVRAT